ncbi:MAG: carboxypeptidase regulatory-like domain-containing protein, partial [Coriobacteriales bacterium]|nr:carboxypeptidase regulatory-like domain-containing protein [Coriobacteriales bacterium]
MKKGLKIGIVALAAAASLGVFASTAQAFPSRTTACSGCHGGSSIAITTTLSSNGASAATYKVSASGASYIAVFNGSSKVTQITGASGNVSIPFGSTYTLYAVKGPGTGDGLGTKSVKATAPAPAPTPTPTPSPTPTPTPDPTPSPDSTSTPSAERCIAKIRVLYKNRAASGAKVTFINEDTGTVYVRRTSRYGWIAPRLPMGEYKIKIEYKGRLRLQRELELEKRVFTKVYKVN